MTLQELLHAPFDKAHPLPFTGLDLAFANFLQQQQPSHDPRHVWLAALTSHQWGRGHACLDLSALSEQTDTLLGWSTADLQALPSGLAQAAATLPWVQGDTSPLVYQASSQLLYLRRAWHAESLIRSNIQARLAQPQTVPSDVQQQLDLLFPNAPPHDPQRHACALAARHNITLITGGPGTGKTTTVVRVLALLVKHAPTPLRIHLAAPTGKAAARLSESITRALGQLPADVRARIPTQAQTLHRLLPTQAQPSVLATDVVVVDEASMVDLEMMARLLQAVPLHARLILLGDKDQLASVEAGAVMSQLCTGPLLQQQTATLTHSHRFDAQSGIGQWAQAVNQDHPLHHLHHLQALWTQAPEGFATTLHANAPQVSRLSWPSVSGLPWASGLRHAWRDYLSQLQALREASGCSNTQASQLLQAFAQFAVLCAVREGPWGVAHFNRQIAAALQLNPLGHANDWYAGRPVMVTRNDYALGLMNGDIGICLPDAQGVLRVAFAAPQHAEGVRWVACARLDQVETVFAMTVHKSQGSEFNHVLLVLPAQSSPVLTRELVYTGITRAKQHLTLWAPQPEVLWQACARRVWRSGGLGQFSTF